MLLGKRTCTLHALTDVDVDDLDAYYGTAVVEVREDFGPFAADLNRSAGGPLAHPVSDVCRAPALQAGQRGTSLNLDRSDHRGSALTF